MINSFARKRDVLLYYSLHNMNKVFVYSEDDPNVEALRSV